MGPRFDTYICRCGEDRHRAQHLCTDCLREEGFDRALVQKYGMTRADFDAMVEAQGNRCAICDQPPTQRRLQVDH